MDGIDTNAGVADIAWTRPVATAPVARAAAPASVAGTAAAPAGTGANLISLLADAAPPIDSKKVDAIRSLIAEGRYPIDERAIAAKMTALDLPERAAG